MTGPFLDSLSNLSVGVAAVVVMYLMYKGTMARLKEKDHEFLDEIKDREKKFEELSHKILNETTKQLSENTKVLGRVIFHLDKHDKL